MSGDPFFIVGSGRSGSTLLRLLLSNHSRIHIPPETWFIIPLVERLPLNRVLTAGEIETALDIMISHYRWPDLGIDAAELRQRAKRLESPHLRTIVDLVYARQLASSGKERLGDKTPPYITILPQLQCLYPEAKFIHLVRDGRDVSISFIELTYECRYYDGTRFEWIAALKKAISYRNSRVADRMLEIKYEDLVSRPEATLSSICTFLGERFEPSMVTANVNLASIPDRERVIHGKISQPMSDNFISVWKRKLSALECFLMESCLSKYLRAFGYELRFRQWGWRPFLLITGSALRSASPLLDRGVPFLRRRNLFPRNFYF